MVYSKCSGKWQLLHIHQSLPYSDQMDGEYYPKTLMEQVSESRMKINDLELQVKMDSLTGILNHQAFYDMAGHMSTAGVSGYFMIIDVDDFKQINDTYEHLYGDRILKSMGAILKEITGENDIAGRIGGDEFALFFENVGSEEQIKKLAADIIRFATEKYKHEDMYFPGISIGIGEKKQGTSSIEALKQADTKMYEAKRHGKNNYSI